ncbi:tonB family protein [Plesiocystis pacifica SIR-1]|uniref:TonB family protein n=2 Tax=Plesiocystis pacifica TaxID=191768 RepID=A6FXN5_9BACT|nr:tonB family protein [Plesiocystis pacifica SIR-1]
MRRAFAALLGASPRAGFPSLAPALALALALSGLSTPALAGAPESAEQPELVPPKATSPLVYDYPEALLERDEPPSGTVNLQYVVGIDGVPKEIEVLDSPDPALAEAAVEALAALRFRPGTYGGQAVEIVLTIALEYTPPEAELPQDEGDPDANPAEDGAGPGEDTDDADDTDEQPDGPERILGTLLEAGSGTPVGGATVLAVPAGDYPEGRVRRQRYGDESEPAWIVQSRADDLGRFSLRAVPDGRVRLIFLAPNFERLEWVVSLEPNTQLETKYFLTRDSATPFRTEVTVDREAMPEAVVRTITTEEINEIPGTQGDALKAVQNFPGVSRQAFGAGQLAIRGAAPGDSGVYLGYHEIPTLFHFGGISSVFNSDVIAQLDFIPGNFDSRYGDALGGVVNVQPRRGRRDGYHGYFDADLFDAGLLVEGPVGEGSFVLSGRRSYVDVILPAVIPDEVGLGLTVAPRYWDYQALFDYPLPKPVGGELSVRAFGSDDRSKLIFAEANEIEADDRDALETVQWFHRVDLVYRKLEGPWEFLITPSYKREFASSSIFGATRFDVESDTFSGRAELSRRLTKNAQLRVGAEVVSTWYAARAELPGFGPGAPSPALASASTRETDYVRVAPALYGTLTLRAGQRLMLFPGVRLSHTSDLAAIERTVADPRLRFILKVADNTKLKGGVGLYSQAPGLLQGDVVFGNPRLLPERSLHTSLSVEQLLPRDFSVELTGFYKRLYALSSETTALALVPGEGDPSPQNFANIGAGNIYGGELLVKRALGDRFYGWLSYTLMRSERTPAPGEATQLFDFDQTHILTLIASYDFPLNWRIGARFRLVSGNPYTATVNGVVNGGGGGVEHIPIAGPINGARLPAFHQLDLRVDKTWVYRRIKVTSYLDIQNVYNAENTEFLASSYDFQSRIPILSLPTAPSVGMKIEW